MVDMVKTLTFLLTTALRIPSQMKLRIPGRMKLGISFIANRKNPASEFIHNFL